MHTMHDQQAAPRKPATDIQLHSLLLNLSVPPALPTLCGADLSLGLSCSFGRAAKPRNASSKCVHHTKDSTAPHDRLES